jgi:hypothetical protein
MASRPLSLRRYTHDEARADIRDSGHQILSASDVEEALSISRSLQHIDALLTDIYLKKAILGGFDIAREAIKLRPELRVLTRPEISSPTL